MKYTKKHLREQIIPQIRRGFSVAVYNHLSDVVDEINSLFTFVREKLKLDASEIANLHKQRKLSILISC